MTLIDKYGRPLTHLRITLTHRCNYKCIYCHREGEYSSEDKLDVNDYRIIAKVASILGIRYVKFTGGEPLLRDDIGSILKVFHNTLKGAELSIVTNGFFICDKIGDLKNYVKRINVNLPSLNEIIYEKITGIRGLQKVLKGIKCALNNNINNIKINVVVIKLNYTEIPKIIDYAQEMGVDINLIELIPLRMGANNYRELHVGLGEIEKQLSKMASKVYSRNLQNRTIYLIQKDIKVEVIKSYGNPYFCKGCTRIRITADGKLKPCLMRNDNLADIANILHKKISEEEKVKLLLKKFKIANMFREPYFK